MVIQCLKIIADNKLRYFDSTQIVLYENNPTSKKSKKLKKQILSSFRLN